MDDANDGIDALGQAYMRVRIKASCIVLMVIGASAMIAGFMATVKAAKKECESKETDAEDGSSTEDAETPAKTTPLHKTVFQKIKVYSVPASLFVVSFGAFVLANRVSLKQAAALAGAYESSLLYLKRHQDATEAEIGERKAAFVEAAVSRKYIDDNPPNRKNVIETGYGDTLFYDILSKQYFFSSIDRIQTVEKSIRLKTQRGKFVPFNVFLWLCNVPLMKDGIGDEIGWNPKDRDAISIGVQPQVLDNGERCLVLIYRVHPHYRYLTPATVA